MDIYHSQKNIWKSTGLYTGLESLKTTSKKVVHKASEFLGNKIEDTVTESNDDEILNLLKTQETWKK